MLFLGKVKRIQEAKVEAASEIEVEKKERERLYKMREDEVKNSSVVGVPCQFIAILRFC